MKFNCFVDLNKGTKGRIGNGLGGREGGLKMIATNVNYFEEGSTPYMCGCKNERGLKGKRNVSLR